MAKKSKEPKVELVNLWDIKKFLKKQGLDVTVNVAGYVLTRLEDEGAWDDAGHWTEYRRDAAGGIYRQS